MPPRRSRAKDKVNEPAQNEFQFINLGESAQIRHEDDRSIIREAVMHNYHMKKKQGKYSNVAENPPSGSVTVKDPISQQINVFQLIPTDSEDLQQSYSQYVLPKTRGGQAAMLPSSSPPNYGQVMSTESNLDNWIRQDILPENNPEQENFTLIEERKTDIQRLLHNLNIIPNSLTHNLKLPIYPTTRIEFLIYAFFTTHQTSSLLMIGIHKSWFLASLQDPAYFTVLMAHYSACIALRNNVDDPIEALMLRMESSRIVNERLATGKDALSDGTVGAVASMVLYEANNGSIPPLRAHVAGLQEMISLRGGITQAQFAPAILRQVLWADLIASITLATTPHVLPFPYPLHSPAVSSSLGYAWSEGGGGGGSGSGLGLGLGLGASGGVFGALPDFSIVTDDLDAVFASLRALTDLLGCKYEGGHEQYEQQRESEQKREVEIGEQEGLRYGDELFLVLRSLMFCMSENGNANGNISKLDMVCCMAAIVFSHVCLRDLGFWSDVVGILISRLRGAVDGLLGVDMEREIMNENEEEEAEVEIEVEDMDTGMNMESVRTRRGIREGGEKRLMWALAIGGTAAQEGRAWWVERFGEVCRELGIRDIKEIEGVMSGILWTSEWDAHLQSLWVDAVGGLG